MGAERFDRGEVPGQFRLRKGCVDRGMADRVKDHGFAALAAFQARHEVMPALRDIGRNRAPAERAGRVALLRPHRAFPLSPRGFLARGCVRGASRRRPYGRPAGDHRGGACLSVGRLGRGDELAHESRGMVAIRAAGSVVAALGLRLAPLRATDQRLHRAAGWRAGAGGGPAPLRPAFPAVPPAASGLRVHRHRRGPHAVGLRLRRGDRLRQAGLPLLRRAGPSRRRSCAIRS